MWPWRRLLLVNIGCVLGLASALTAISNDNVVHNKVVAEIWEHGDISLKQKHWFLHWKTQKGLKVEQNEWQPM